MDTSKLFQFGKTLVGVSVFLCVNACVTLRGKVGENLRTVREAC